MENPSASEQSISFRLSEEEEMLRASVRKFAETEIQPNVMKYDEAQEFPLSVFRAMGELGYLGAAVPTDLGGAGLSPVDFAIIMEEISRVDPSVGLILAAHSGLCLQHLTLWANDVQKKKYIPGLAAGNVIGSWCLTEPGSGSDAASMRTSAVSDGGSYVLSGSKAFITNGSHASTYVVLAKTDPAKGHKGISAFIVERDWKGVTVGKKENKLGMRASDTVVMIFDEVRVPRENLIGTENSGFKQALVVLESGRVGIAALCVGLAQGALEASVKYSKERVAFGRPISDFQGIQFKLADMATQIQAARLLTWRAAMAKGQGEKGNLIAGQAKLFASEVAQRAATEAVQIHGGYGITKDFPVEKFYRDVKVLTIGEGTSEVQRMVIAKTVLSL